MEKQQSAETLRKRKFLMVLPLLVLPFMTMAFWALGGGTSPEKPFKANEKMGFNTDLPQPKFDIAEKLDKFSVYEASAREAEQDHPGDNTYNSLMSASPETYIDPNEQKINEKLALLNTEINRQSSTSAPSYSTSKGRNHASTAMTADVSRLEDLMQSLQIGNADDPEMVQVNAILEKILDIQHPGRTREKLEQKSSSPVKGVFAVQVLGEQGTNPASFPPPSAIDNKHALDLSSAIEAVIHQDQDIVSGSVVKIRLSDSISVNGAIIPKNEFVYGIAEVDEERLKITIASMRYKNSILSVSLSAYDLDGLEGLYIPGAISRDASKKGVDDAIQSLQIMTMDPSVSAQVAGAGIQAAKGLFGKKVKQIRVKVKAGYKLLLRDNKLRN